ncbi:MAG: FkbM family methyltransferase [Pseudorhodobacter sp.]|nr:FkbM family methyltransferase [Pseudorhodobacter sp.]
MRHFAKSTLERLSGNRVWLEQTSDLNEVRALLRSLAPVAISCPLVRLGSAGDGGYLAPDDLEDMSASISPGVSTEVGFDLDMAERGMEIYMADASVEGPPVSHPRFHFHKKFLDVFEDDDNMRLDTLCSSIAPEHKGDRLLQMDIEGAEYRVLLDVSDQVLQSFRIMLIEFHHLDRVFATFPFRMIRATFQKMLRFHHIVHIHPNKAYPSESGLPRYGV